MKLPYVTPDETTLPASRGYRVIEATLHARLREAERNLEEAQLQYEMVLCEVDNYEREQRELDDERRRDAMLTTKQEVTP